MTNISPEAVTRREAARDHGRFGEQEHTAPEVALAEVHGTEMQVGATRVMVPFTWESWYEGPLLDTASRIVARHDVTGVASRVRVVRDVANPTMAPYASYILSLRSELTGESGRTFNYTTGDQAFERVTPNVAEALCEAATRAEAAGGHSNGPASDEPTVLDNLIALVGERDARDLLAHAYLQYGQFRSLTLNPR